MRPVLYQPTYTYLVDGLSLVEWTLLASTQMHTETTLRTQQLTLPGVSGALLVPQPVSVVEPAKIKIDLAPAATNPGCLEDALDRLNRVVTAPSLTLVRRRVKGEEDAPQDLHATGICQSISYPKEDSVGMRWARVTLNLLALEGIWKERRLRRVTLTPAPRRRVNGLSGTAPIRDSTIYLTGPATRLHLSDLATHTGITWTGNLAKDETLTIHVAHLTATITRKDTTRTAGAGLDFPAAGVLQVCPRGKAGEVVLGVEVEGSGESTRIELEGARAWL